MLDHSYVLVSVLLVLSRDEDPTVAKKSISVGTTFFCTILEEMAMQVHTFSQVGYLVVLICIFVLKFLLGIFSKSYIWSQ